MGGETAVLPREAEEWLNCADAVDKVVRTRQCGKAAAKLWMRDRVRSREIRVKASSDFLRLHPAYHKKISDNANSGRPRDSDLPKEIDLASDFDVDPFIMDQSFIQLGSLWHAGDLRAALAREVAAAARPGAPPEGQDRKTPGPKPKWDRFGVAA